MVTVAGRSPTTMAGLSNVRRLAELAATNKSPREFQMNSDFKLAASSIHFRFLAAPIGKLNSMNERCSSWLLDYGKSGAR